MDLHFEPKDRLIFRFFDGSKRRNVDPLEIYKKFVTVAPALSVDVKVAFSTVVSSKDAVVAHDTLVAKIREIFNVKTIEEDGLTQAEVIDLFDTFLTFCDNVKKKASFKPIFSTPTEQPSSPNGSTTRPSSDSGSTEEEANTEKPAL